MIRLAITAAAFDAISATLPVGSVAVEPEPNERGEMHVWIDDRLAAMGGPGETYSEVILRLEAESRQERGTQSGECVSPFQDHADRCGQGD
jgi:hypothetical protein